MSLAFQSPPCHHAGMTVYCYDLVPIRRKGSWTRRHDDVMRAEYFPGLDPAMLVEPLRAVGALPMRDGRLVVRSIINRLSELGLRNRMIPL